MEQTTPSVQRRANGLGAVLVAVMLLFGCGGSGGGSGDRSVVSPANDKSRESFEFSIHSSIAESEDSEFLQAIDNVIGGALRPFDQIDNIFEGRVTLPIIYGSTDLHANCAMPNAFYSSNRRQIVICHALIVSSARVFRRDLLTTQPDISIADANLSAFRAALLAAVFYVYHEAGHALVDIGSIAIGGNAESVVDSIATVLSVETQQPFSPLFAANYFGLTTSGSGSAAIHGNGVDRANDIYCWTIGSSSLIAAQFPVKANELIAEGRDCTGEYADIRNFVESLIPDLGDLPPVTADLGSR